MHKLLLLQALILGLVILSKEGCFATINNNPLPHYEYPGPAVSEKDLPICPENAVCSILHNRYWMSPVIKRLCRCLRRIECPEIWTDYPDTNTMHLDNRSQLKFCDDVSELTECEQQKVALTIITTATTEIKDTSPASSIEEERKLAVNVSCFCPSSFIWEEHPQKHSKQAPENGTIIVTHFTCKPMQKCSSYEFCGNIRADYFSTYYHCSCPIAHMCVNNNRTLLSANELLYKGQVYQAFCYPQ